MLPNISKDIIITPRLRLRPLSVSDSEILFQLRSSQKHMKYMGSKPYTHLEQSKQFIQTLSKDLSRGDAFYWGIEIKANLKLIGTICLWNFDLSKKEGEIGYELSHLYQNQGFMQEAANAVIRFGFETIELKCIKAVTHKEHLASLKLLKKLNFTLLGQANIIDPDLDEGPEMLLLECLK